MKDNKTDPNPPLTLDELHETAQERVHLISEEFTEGFAFLQKYPKSVTFFGGARFKETDKEYEAARNLSGRIVKELNYSIFTGGGPGIMEAANRGAFENDGQSLGINIELAQAQVKNPYITDNLDFYYFFSRKVCLSFSAEAYVFFPGGFGTLDEFFEIITLVQTGKIEKMPVILFGSEYWKSIDELLHKELLSRGVVDKEDLNLYTITDDADEVINIIKNAPVRNGMKFQYPKTELIAE